MTKKTFEHVAVVMGGPSAEREVSLKSGEAISTALESVGYQVQRVVLEEARLPDIEADAAFVAIHGEFGEDGGVQRFLEELKIPYVGTRAADMASSFNKILAKEKLRAAGLPVAPDEILPRGFDTNTVGYPCVVKPPQQGSSIGISIVKSPEEFPAALAVAREFEDEILVEEYIPGRELTVGIVGERVLPTVEIVPAGDTYDFDAKYTYTRGKTEYRVPAELPGMLAPHIFTLASEAFWELGGRHVGRVDFRLNEADELFILELNTIPGFTENSLLPKAAKSAGMKFPELCATLMEMAE